MTGTTELRYRVTTTAMHHPYMKRYSASQGKTVPKIIEGYEVFDTLTSKEVGEPSTKLAATYERARELNELPALTVAKVSAVLRKAGHGVSKSHATRVRGWHNITRGAGVSYARDGRIAVEFVAGGMRAVTPDERARVLAKYRSTLEAAGLTVTEGDGTLFV